MGDMNDEEIATPAAAVMFTVRKCATLTTHPTNGAKQDIAHLDRHNILSLRNSFIQALKLMTRDNDMWFEYELAEVIASNGEEVIIGDINVRYTPWSLKGVVNPTLSALAGNNLAISIDVDHVLVSLKMETSHHGIRYHYAIGRPYYKDGNNLRAIHIAVTDTPIHTDFHIGGNSTEPRFLENHKISPECGVNAQDNLVLTGFCLTTDSHNTNFIRYECCSGMLQPLTESQSFDLTSERVNRKRKLILSNEEDEELNHFWGTGACNATLCSKIIGKKNTTSGTKTVGNLAGLVVTARNGYGIASFIVNSDSTGIWLECYDGKPQVAGTTFVVIKDTTLPSITSAQSISTNAYLKDLSFLSLAAPANYLITSIQFVLDSTTNTIKLKCAVGKISSDGFTSLKFTSSATTTDSASKTVASTEGDPSYLRYCTFADTVSQKFLVSQIKFSTDATTSIKVQLGTVNQVTY